MRARTAVLVAAVAVLAGMTGLLPLGGGLLGGVAALGWWVAGRAGLWLCKRPCEARACGMCRVGRAPY